MPGTVGRGPGTAMVAAARDSDQDALDALEAMTDSFVEFEERGDDYDWRAAWRGHPPDPAHELFPNLPDELVVRG